MRGQIRLKDTTLSLGSDLLFNHCLLQVCFLQIFYVSGFKRTRELQNHCPLHNEIDEAMEEEIDDYFIELEKEKQLAAKGELERYLNEFSEKNLLLNLTYWHGGKLIRLDFQHYQKLQRMFWPFNLQL